MLKLPPDNAGIEDKVNWCMLKICELYSNQGDSLPSKPWYTSVGIWFSLLLAILMLYGIYLLYEHSTGHVINVFGYRFK